MSSKTTLASVALHGALGGLIVWGAARPKLHKATAIAVVESKPKEKPPKPDEPKPPPPKPPRPKSLAIAPPEPVPTAPPPPAPVKALHAPAMKTNVVMGNSGPANDSGPGLKVAAPAPAGQAPAPRCARRTKTIATRRPPSRCR